MFRSLVVALALTISALPALAETNRATGVAAEPKGPVSPAPRVPRAPTQVKDEKGKNLSFAEEYQREMKSCMESWDAGTNMTKGQWHRTCERILKHRLPIKRATRAGTQ